MAFTYDPLFAADPNNPSVVASNAAITIFDPADNGMAPITITDVTDSPLSNPITVNKNGFGPAFQHATLDRVGWHGGGFTGYFTSYEGMKQVATDAQTAAENAAADAAEVVGLALGPTDAQVDAGIVRANIPSLAAAAVAAAPTVIDAANTAVTNKVNGLSLITYGTAIGTAHLDTLTTPGQYTQGTTGNVTTAQGYPVAGEPVIVEVLSMGGETRVQRVTPAWGTSQGKVTWQRTRTNIATGWDAWTATSAQRVDTALGKFETWDDQRKRWQISPTSDTGWRNISTTLENGWTASEILVRRFGYRVALLMRNVQAGTAATIVTLPTGFAPRSGGVILSSLTDSPSWSLRVTVADTGVVSVPLTSTVPDIRQEWSWSTLQAWPTALPGSASGSIPNA